jgi:hypothetical protein
MIWIFDFNQHASIKYKNWVQNYVNCEVISILPSHGEASENKVFFGLNERNACFCFCFHTRSKSMQENGPGKAE